jgi:hypothetical protein
MLRKDFQIPPLLDIVSCHSRPMLFNNRALMAQAHLGDLGIWHPLL